MGLRGKYTAGGIFITGTSTAVGKSYVGAMIARTLVDTGVRVGVYKPVESGCARDGDALIAADAQQLWIAAGRPGELRHVCPQRYEAALAPPQAAALAGHQVDAALLRGGLDYWRERSDIVLVEGAGGLMSPLSEADYNIDLAKDLGLPLLIVAANELGVINATLQSLITSRALAPGLPVAGVVLNQSQQRPDDHSTNGNGVELARRCDVPLLATVAHGQQAFETNTAWLALAKGLTDASAASP
ncbi:MAG: dethiobiotin synthase [Pirellulales bacterium]|nr:dethiobiotin synthase [Pirellulales bacterium]